MREIKLPSRKDGTDIFLIIECKDPFGEPGLDIRKWMRSGPGYNGPTKQGIRIPYQYLNLFQTLVNEVINEHKAKGDVTE